MRVTANVRGCFANVTWRVTQILYGIVGGFIPDRGRAIPCHGRIASSWSEARGQRFESCAALKAARRYSQAVFAERRERPQSKRHEMDLFC